MNYNKFAYLYNQIEHEDMIWNTHIERYSFFKELPDLENLRILELGSSAGIIAEHCLDKGAKEVIGIDSSRTMNEYALKRNKDKFKTHCFDLNEKFNVEGEFDLIISSLTLHYIEEWTNIIESIYKHLKPNGELIIQISNFESVFPDSKHNELIKETWIKDGEEMHIEVFAKHPKDVIEFLENRGFTYLNSVDSLPSILMKEINNEAFEYANNNPLYSIYKFKKIGSI